MLRRFTGPGVAAAVALVAAVGLAGCGSPDPQRSAAGTTTARTPEYSVSSTFSLPTLPVVGSSGTATPTASAPTPVSSDQALTGRTVLLDPGHNGGNATHPEIINRRVDAGGFTKECDTTGTSTTGTASSPGYPEYAFTLDVAQRMTALLRARGARVVLTRTLSSGVGPCVDQRAAAGNTVNADAALSIHADGGPPSGVGFHVIRPGLLPGRNDAVIGPSQSLSDAIHAAMVSTGEPTSTYAGQGGYAVRTDLGGLNLSTVPKVFVECGNMRNSADATRLSDPAFRQRLAAALTDGLGSYLFGR